MTYHASGGRGGGKLQRLRRAAMVATFNDWNPRYVLYAVAQGNGPQEQMAIDRERWPGGLMTGFILWIGERWRQWLDANPERNRLHHSPEDHRDFDDWLWAVVVFGSSIPPSWRQS
jgi:hypothetical protein